MDIQKLFTQLHAILKRYNEYKFESHNNVIRSQREMAYAFNILLVVTNHRDAMLFQSFEDQSPEQTGVEEIKRVMNEMYMEIKDVISNKDIGFYVDKYNDLWIYNKKIQAEVDIKKDTKYFADILRYVFPYPRVSKITAFINFMYNNETFIGTSCEELGHDEIDFLRTQLMEFRKLSTIVGGKVSLQITFK